MIPKTYSRYNTPQFIKPPKSGTSQLTRIFVGTRGFDHTRNARRCYYLVVDHRGCRVAGADFLLDRGTTREKALAFAAIRAKQWQADNQPADSTIIYLRPESTKERATS